MNEQHAIVTADQSSAYTASQINLDEDASASDGASTKSDVVQTRFGEIHIRRDNPIVFAKGLLGMPDKSSFCLVNFPLEKFPQFKLLQSLDDDELSFIVLPVETDNTIIDREDIEAGCKDLGFAVDDTALLLIVSVHRELRQVRLSVNARAPLFMHANKRKAEQYVLHNNKYVVRHMITGESG